MATNHAQADQAMVEQLRPIVVVVGYVLIKPYVPSWGKRCCFAAGQWSGALFRKALRWEAATKQGGLRLVRGRHAACSGSSVVYRVDSVMRFGLAGLCSLTILGHNGQTKPQYSVAPSTASKKEPSTVGSHSSLRMHFLGKSAFSRRPAKR